MISLKHRFIFLHVPKTGGSSIVESLGHYGEGDLIEQNSRRREVFQMEGGVFSALNKHANYRDHAVALKREGYDIRDFRVVSVVRNPWDLAVSYYFFKRELRGIAASQPSSREGLVQSIRAVRRWTEFWSARPAIWKISNRVEGAFRRAGLRARLPVEALAGSGFAGRIDTVLRFEYLNDDYMAFCRETGLECAKPLKARNKTTRDSYQKYYDEELKEMVEDRFWREIDHFGYDF